MQRLSVVCRRAGLVIAGLMSVGLGVRGTAMLVRPGEIEFVPTGVLIAFVCMLLLPLLTLWAVRLDSRTAVRLAVQDLASDETDAQAPPLTRRLRLRAEDAEQTAPRPAHRPAHPVVHAAQSRRDRAAAHRIAVEVDRMLTEA